MTENSGELVITLDFKKLFALSLLVIITLVSVYTYIVVLLAWDAPTEEISVQFDGYNTYDNYGAGKTQFNPGDLLDFRVNAETAERYWLPPSYEFFVGNINYRIIITIFAPDGTPMLCASDTGSLANDTSQYHWLENDFLGYFYQIPSDAVASTAYKVRVVFWTDWLPGGKSKAVQAWEFSFEVL